MTSNVGNEAGAGMMSGTGQAKSKLARLALVLLRLLLELDSRLVQAEVLIDVFLLNGSDSVP